ncbi:MAG: hypothetical protein OXG79_01220 [Chloroflexi bacterium]|nr:hypothetical protein [Chloroflexota bacterium]
MNSTPDSQAAARLAAAVGQILPVDGERSLTAVAAQFDLQIAPADDVETFAGQLIVTAGEADRLDDVVRVLVTESVLYRREAREPVDSVEYGELSAAAQALGVAVPPLEEIDGATADVDGAERRTRLLGAMFALYSDMMSGPEEDRPLKLANVLGGLLRANDIDILRLPQVRAHDVRGVVRMGGIEHLLTAVWEVGDDPLEVDTSEESIQAQDRRTLIVALQGFPREMRLDPERDRRKILLDGRDLTLLLEGRWTVPHAVRWKAREQRETGVFARLPIAPPENDPTALALSSDTAEIVEVDADQKTLAANVAEFDQTISEEIEASEAEAKRLRVIGFILAGIAAVVVAGLFVNSKIQESIAEGNLDAASVTAMRAAQAQEDALERLEVTGLNRYFSDDVIASIRQQIESLRANNVYITARIDREVLRENSGVQDELAFIAFRETGETELRGQGDGRIISSDPAYRAVLGFIMSRSEAGQWMVTDRRVFDTS